LTIEVVVAGVACVGLNGGPMFKTHGPGSTLVYDDDRGGRLVVMARDMIVDDNKPMVPHADGT
jgi:hypothetical protein